MARNAKNTRMCAGCMQRKSKHELLCITKPKDKEPIIEGLGGNAEGRGMYICADVACVEKAIKRKSFSRNLRCEISPDLYENIKNFVKTLNLE